MSKESIFTLKKDSIFLCGKCYNNGENFNCDSPNADGSDTYYGFPQSIECPDFICAFCLYGQEERDDENYICEECKEDGEKYE